MPFLSLPTHPRRLRRSGNDGGILMEGIQGCERDDVHSSMLRCFLEIVAEDRGWTPEDLRQG